MKKFIIIAITAFPFFTFAQELRDINSVAQKATNLGNLTIEIIIGLAIVWIIFYSFKYFIADGEEGRTKGGMSVLFGVIGLFVILSIWGLVYILINSFTFQKNTRPPTDNIRIPDPTSGGNVGGSAVNEWE